MKKISMRNKLPKTIPFMPTSLPDKANCVLYAPMWNGLSNAGKIKDYSKEANHGTPTDIGWARWAGGMCPEFNGTSSILNFGNSINFTDKHTLIWLMRIESGIAWRTFWSKMADTDNFVRASSSDIGTEVIIVIRSGGVGTVYISSGTLVSPKMYFFAVTIDNTNQEINYYVNNSLKGTDSAFVLPSISSTNFVLGSRSTPGSYTNISSPLICMWNRVWSKREILDFYHKWQPYLG